MSRRSKIVRVDRCFDSNLKMMYPEIESTRIRTKMLNKKLEEMLYGKKKKLE